MLNEQQLEDLICWISSRRAGSLPRGPDIAPEGDQPAGRFRQWWLRDRLLAALARITHIPAAAALEQAAQ